MKEGGKKLGRRINSVFNSKRKRGESTWTWRKEVLKRIFKK